MLESTYTTNTAHTYSSIKKCPGSSSRKEATDQENKSVYLQTDDKVRKLKHYIGMAKIKERWYTDLYNSGDYHG